MPAQVKEIWCSDLRPFEGPKLVRETESSYIVPCDEYDSHTWCGNLKPQSEPIADETDSSTTMVQETVQFTDEQEVTDEGYITPLDTNALVDQVNTADLATFLARPVRISSFTWFEADPSDISLQTLKPWHLFFNDTRIKFKLNNFSFIRCDLKIKVMINASPFYYGCMGMTYLPLPVLTPSTIVNPTTLSSLMPLSQRPISYIYPQHSLGAEMTLPFFLHKNWLDINTATDFTDMGELSFTPFTTLQSANGVVGTGVTVQIYAWAENVQLSGSTLSLALQSKVKDEYGNGPISGPASTVARMAGMMRKVPIIGKFATATEIGASAISGIASLFGFTNVPIIDNIVPYQVRAFPSLASTEIGFPNEKLTLHAKNELTIDPTVVGAPSGDPLAIENFVNRESLITRTIWSTAQPVDTILFYSRVHPFMFTQDLNTNNGIINRTPLSIPAQLFDGWRGDIIFRFKIVASPYHKGRVIISFDPQGDVVNNVVTVAQVSSAIYTQIVDLGADDDVEIVVPYNQALPFLSTNPTFSTGNIPFKNTTAPTWNVVEGTDNGAIIVRVLTTLTAPVATAPVSILCYVRGGDNMEFGNPRPVQVDTSDFVVQSKPVSVEDKTIKTMSNVGVMTLPDQMRINYGEVIKSLRVLLRRANYIYTLGEIDVSLNNAIIRSYFGKLPPTNGYDPNGLHSANKLVGAGSAPFNYVKRTPLSVILPCFIGYRGSGVWTFNSASNDSLKSISVTRTPDTNLVAGDGVTTFAAPTNHSVIPQRGLLYNYDTAGGVALTNQLTQSGLSVLCPNYNEYKFNSTRVGSNTKPPTSGTSFDGAANDGYVLTIPIKSSANVINTTIDKFWHAGADFQPLFFINVPTLYRITSIPTPAP